MTIIIQQITYPDKYNINRMLQNLKEFVTKLIQNDKKDAFPHLYIVDKQTGPYRKIQDAIDAAQPNSLIKVTQGFYQQNLYITKPITIQPKSLNSSPQNENKQKIGVVLLIQSGIGIHIKLPYSQNEVHISGLKVSHTGNSPQLHMQLLNHQHILNIFEDNEKQIDQLEHQYINRVMFNKIQNMIMMVQVGKVYISMCVLSLKYLVKSCRLLIPGVCVDKQGELNMTDCEIKGNENKETVGILCKLGVINIKNCIMNDHKQGGIQIWGIKDNQSKITKTKFQKNSIAIQVTGQQFKLKVCQNTIIKNKIGIKIGLACQIEISRNYICENMIGIQGHSCLPVIYLNKINKNTQNGIVMNSYKSMICCGKIKKNVSICGNGSNGIVIAGQNNKTKIIQNYLIGYNKKAGIKIQKQSFPLILKNKIHKNYQQGILITQDANAIIQKNTISSNIECNIALGGSISHNTLIVENTISNSNGAGIIMIEGLCNISRNDIVQNVQGIKLISSSGRIRRNYIAKNHNDGIHCVGQCNPTLVENLITRNQSIGLLFRQQNGLVNSSSNSSNCNISTIYSNIIVSNQINVGLLFKNQEVKKCLSASNTIQGTINQPLTFSCALI